MSKFLLSCLVAFAAAGLPLSASAHSHLSPITAANIDSELAAATQFESFKLAYSRNYESDAEEEYRFTVFKQNLQVIAKQNQANGSPSFGVNQFADLSQKEFAVRFLGYVPKTGAAAVERLDWPVASPEDGLHNHHLRHPAAPETTEFDWREKSAVTPVKDQGQCGSCWAFSATEELESAWFLGGKGPLPILAPQQVVSCDTAGTDQGCGGGDTVTAYKYLEGVGQEGEVSVPYTSGLTGDNGQCTYDATKVIAKISNFTYATPPCFDTCTSQNENTLLDNVLAHGPASICVNAASWQTYTNGVINAAACGDSAYTSLDHCVMLTGFNTSSDGTKYWNVRNSWAAGWGEAGYIWLAFGQNTCGVADESTFAVV